MGLMYVLLRPMMQSPEDGCLPLLVCMCASDLKEPAFYGPKNKNWLSKGIMRVRFLCSNGSRKLGHAIWTLPRPQSSGVTSRQGYYVVSLCGHPFAWGMVIVAPSGISMSIS